MYIINKNMQVRRNVFFFQVPIIVLAEGFVVNWIEKFSFLLNEFLDI